MGTQVQKSLDEVGWDKVRSSVPLVKSGRSCRLRKMPSLCSVWRKTAGLLPWLVLGCQSTPVSNGTGVVNPTSYEEVQEAASSERLNDSLRLQRWGSERAESVGDIVVLTGEIKGEPFRLWFISQQRVPAVGHLELDEDGAAQIVVGRPYTYVSNRVELSLSVWENGTRGYLSGSATRPEIFSGRRHLKFAGDITLQVVSPHSHSPAMSMRSEMRPLTDYTPLVLPERPVSGEAAPPGYMLRKRTNIPLMVAGGAIFLGTYALSVVGAAATGFDGNAEAYLVPVAGPSLFLAQNIRDGKGIEPNLFSGLVYGFATVGATALQAGGLIVMGAGLIFPRREWVFSSYKTARMMDRFVVVPVVSESFRGVNFAGTF